MIVVEGPDASGKTTLARWIADEYGLDYRRSPYLSSTEGPSDAHLSWWEKQLKGKTAVGGVYDRTHYVSELMYLHTPEHKLLSYPQRFNRGLYAFIKRVDLLIFCLPPWPVQLQVLEDTNRASLVGADLDMLHKIAWNYEALYAMWTEILRERVTVYDYTSMTKAHLEEVLVGFSTFAT